MAIVTSTYRYKRPPGKRKPVAIEAPAVVTIDPKTRMAKEGRRETSPDEKAAAKVRNRVARTPAAMRSQARNRRSRPTTTASR
jgi:hypothetical protein